jgi:hypothetical protein
MLTTGGAGYFRSAIVRPYVESKQLRRVEHAPEFSYSIYAVYSTRSAAEAVELVRTGLHACAGRDASSGRRLVAALPT